MSDDNASLNDGEDRQLLPNRESQEEAVAESAELGTLSKIAGIAVVLLLVSFAFVVELRATRHRQVWDLCLASRCILVSLSLVATVALELLTLRPREVPLARIGNVMIRQFQSCIDAPHQLCSKLSGLFVLTLVIFGIPSCLSMVTEIACEIIERKEKSEWETHSTVMIIWRALTFCLIILQIRLGFKYRNKSIQLRLSLAWIMLSVIMAVNIAIWFSTVGLEVQGLNGAEKVIPKGSYCEKNSIGYFNDLLYPFQIEFCVMTSLLAYTLMHNMGRLGESLQSSDTSSGGNDAVGARGNAFVELSAMRNYAFWSLASLLFLIGTLAGATFIHFDDPNDVHRGLAFDCVLLIQHACGILCISLLICYARVDRERRTGAGHFADRLLLWVGAAAIVLNCLYRIWEYFIIATQELQDISNAIGMNSTAHPTPKLELSQVKRARELIQVISRFLNIFQCMSQVALLEWALVSRFSNTNRLFQCQIGNAQSGSSDQPQVNENPDDKLSDKIRVMLNLLLTINGSEWLLSAVCFNYFFTGDQKDALSLLLLPLHVFFRFHSAVCCHDFKKHMRMETVQADDNTGSVQAEFANSSLTHQV